jgi:FAD dependent oxidoreductase
VHGPADSRGCSREAILGLRVAIIGAGWYGCHLGLALANLRSEVTIFERHQRALHEASGNNQFRLHTGFHYARHHGTRQQSRDGFLRFQERYPSLSHSIAKNIYAVPSGDSLIDFATYKLIMASSGIDFIEMADYSPWIRNVEGAMLTHERVLLIAQARQFFQKRLDGALHFGTTVKSVIQRKNWIEVEGERFDYLIDASWGHFGVIPMSLYYEPTILLYYETKEEFPAITFVDGPLASIYPTEDPSIFTLSSVVHTPLCACETSSEARGEILRVDGGVVGQKRAAMEEQILANVPGFRDAFRFIGAQLSIKTKPRGRSDDRSCYVFRKDNVISVMSGKIDTIFHAAERVLSIISEGSGGSASREESTIRADIFIPQEHVYDDQNA